MSRTQYIAELIMVDQLRNYKICSEKVMYICRIELE